MAGMNKPIHLINYKDPTRGGAQRILGKISKCEQSEVNDFNDFKQDSFLGTCFFIISWIFQRRGRIVILHHRAFLVLVPFLRLFHCRVLFYCHAGYRNKMWLFRLLKCHGYIAVSDSVRQKLLVAGVCQNKIAVVSNPFMSDYEVGSVPIVNAKTLEVGYVGALEKWKGILNLVSFMDQYVQKMKKSVVLRVVGAGSLFGELNSMPLCDELDVKLLGYNSRPFELLANTPIIVIPSLEEGFGLMAIESIYYGKIIVYSDIPALRELCERDELAIRFDVLSMESFELALDTALKLISDMAANEERYREIVSRRVEYVKENFSSENFIGRYEDVVSSFI